MIGASIRFTAYVSNRETEIDEVMTSEREWSAVESLHKRPRNHMRLAMAALARPRMERQLMFFRGFASR
jgi:hypothetical protein